MDTTTTLLSASTAYTLIFVLLIATYNIFLKKYLSSTILISLFWINLFTYLCYLIYYFFKKFYFRGDVYAIEELLHEYTFYNAPFYILIAISAVGSLVLFNNLIQKYEISVIIGFSQVSLLIGSLGIILFGGTYSWQNLLGLFIIFIGALIVPLKNFSWKNPLSPFLTLSPGLVYNIFIYALFLATERIITFLITQQTTTTQGILDTLAHVFPFSFQNLYFYNIGSRFFITLAFFIYLWSHQQYKGNIISTLKNNFKSIALVSALAFASAFVFQMAFYYSENKLVLGALAKLSVPLMIILGYIVLDEKITWAKVIGSSLIVFGGTIALLF